MSFGNSDQIEQGCVPSFWSCKHGQRGTIRPARRDSETRDGVRVQYVPHTLEYGSAEALSSLTTADFGEYDTIKHPGARARKLMTRAVLRRTLSEEVNHAVCPQQWTFERKGNGHPVLGASCPQLGFSCSHADGLSMVAVTQGGAIGIDVVNVCPKMEISLAEMYLAPGEIRSLGDISRPTAENRQAFCRYWAVKEACLKLSGGALSERIKEIELDPVEDQLKSSTVVDTTYSEVRLETWQLFKLGRNFAAAIAVGPA